MVLVYRTTGVLNIAHGGVGVLCGFCAWDLITLRGWPYYLGVAVGSQWPSCSGWPSSGW
jgi:branched-subunit amino acid ABC-type transport system permease component